MRRKVDTIGRAVIITGEVSATVDLTIEDRSKGRST